MILQDIIDEAVSQFREALQELDFVNASELGLDNRCGGVYVNVQESMIIADFNDSALQYYGGFEYVPEEAKLKFGEWTIYYGDENTRVQQAINRYMDSH